jgi:hypothetical protein
MQNKNTYLLVGIGLAGSWIIAMASYLASGQTGADWFSRSGAVMCLLAAAANFALVKVHQRDLAEIFKDHEKSMREKAEKILKPPEVYTRLARSSYLTGIVGTAIWGYGDLLL